MSVVPPPVTNLARHRLPRELGGTGRDPVFELDTDELSEELIYCSDPENPEGHGFLEPSRRMSFEEYQHIRNPRPVASAAPGRAIMRIVMEQAQQPDVAERVADLALAEPYARSLLTIRGYAVGLLDAGYTREVLYEHFKRARSVLERRGAPEDTEEAILDVMDFLVGFSSSFMKL